MPTHDGMAWDGYAPSSPTYPAGGSRFTSLEFRGQGPSPTSVPVPVPGSRFLIDRSKAVVGFEDL